MEALLVAFEFVVTNGSYVLGFLVAIGLLVTVHEFGHFWVARRLGVKVLRFSVGFGRPILVKRAGPDDTEYVLAAIPLGGYVKMLDEREGAVASADVGRAFNRKSLAVRISVVLAGPAANFLFAVLVYWVMYVVGVPGLRATVGGVVPESIADQAGLAVDHTIVAVDDRPVKTWQGVVNTVVASIVDEPGLIDLEVIDADGRRSVRMIDASRLVLDDLTEGQFFETVGLSPMERLPPVIGKVFAGGPAATAGLRAGDKVLKADDRLMPDWKTWREYVRKRPGKPIDLVVQRAGRSHILRIIPAVTKDGGHSSVGKIHAEVSLDGYYVTERYSVLEAFPRAVERTYGFCALTLGVLWKMIQFEVSFKNLSGPISIAQYAGIAVRRGLSDYLHFLAIVSISLGILNLLPIPVLDGGHLVLYIVEFVKGGPLSEQSLAIGQQVGVVFLVGLMSLAFYNDLARLFG